jgi:hypothetical protein
MYNPAHNGEALPSFGAGNAVGSPLHTDPLDRLYDPVTTEPFEGEAPVLSQPAGTVGE